MTRREFLLLMGFNNAACTCHPKMMLNEAPPATWAYERDSQRLHYSDDGMNMVLICDGVPKQYYVLTVPFMDATAIPAQWPDQVKKIIGGKKWKRKT